MFKKILHAELLHLYDQALAREDQWSSKTLFSSQGNAGQPPMPVHQNRQAPSTGKARGSLIVQTSKLGFVHSGAENLKPGSDIIEIRATDKLIHEVSKDIQHNGELNMESFPA